MPQEHTPVLETVHMGLQNRQHRAFVPEGSLVVAENVVYGPGAFALEPAKGRRVVGAGVRHADHPITQMVGMEWDKETKVEPDVTGEYQQILYQADGKLRTLVADANYAGPGLAPETSRELVLPPGLALGTKPLSLANYGGEQIVATGAKPLLISRDEVSGELVQQLGVPGNTVRPVFFKQATGGSGISSYIDYWVWVVFGRERLNVPGEDESTVVEWGAAEADTVSRFRNSSQWNGSVYVADPWNRVDVYLGKDEVDAILTDPSEWFATLYIAETTNTGAGGPGPGLENTSYPAKNPWPFGFRFVERFNVSSILQSAVVGGAAGWSHAWQTEGIPEVGKEYYYVGTFDYNWTNAVVVQERFSKPHEPYDIVSVTLDGEAANASEFFAPPPMNFVTMFQQSLVFVDPNDVRSLRFSVPGSPGHCPDIYFVPLETERWDEILMAVPLGRILGVFSKNGVFRLNYLPSGSDANFRDGQVFDELLVRGGLVNSQAVTKVDYGPGVPMVVYVSLQGIFALDLGDTQLELTQNIDWHGMVTPAALASCILVDDPERQRLEFHYRPYGGAPDRKLVFHYAQSQLNRGIPAVTGPVFLAGRTHEARLVAVSDGTQRVVTTTLQGEICYGELGWKDASVGGAETPLRVRQRQIFPAGLTQRAMFDYTVAHLESLQNGGQTEVQRFDGPDQNPTNVSGIKVDVEAEFDDELHILTAVGSGQWYQVEVKSPPTIHGGHKINALGVLLHESGDA